MAQNYSAFKMRSNYNKMTSYKSTISNTVENKVENWFKERISARATSEPDVPLVPKKSIKTHIQVSKPPGLQKYTFSDAEINEVLRIPPYKEFCYVDLVSKKDYISDFLMHPLEYSTPLFSQ